MHTIFIQHVYRAHTAFPFKEIFCQVFIQPLEKIIYEPYQLACHSLSICLEVPPGS